MSGGSRRCHCLQFAQNASLASSITLIVFLLQLQEVFDYCVLRIQYPTPQTRLLFLGTNLMVAMISINIISNGIKMVVNTAADTDM